ncbi:MULTISPECIES: excinuclease ABC subunit A [unclassified Salipiger]|uniref:excinuclease ABC subunit A n=1 Tax=unclassified Salipiger TaxID=2640570 RepID=UPI0013BB41E6|nr:MULTISPECIES: excinuclease ABC subunit A [unclassified Salipiger]NDV51776.1 excinuclease ABC subunit A [Salipiger sp. PrR003]NDW31944.1 excinuclease ABC subunit A [Salipiger sp. PrR007]
MLRTLTLAALSAAALAAPMAASAAPKGCPPGLAKKNAACMPPGQYKKIGKHHGDRDRDHDAIHIHRYDRGERIRDNYIVIRDPGRYQLDPHRTYYNVDDYVYRVDPDTGAVLDIIGGIAQLAK